MYSSFQTITTPVIEIEMNGQVHTYNPSNPFEIPIGHNYLGGTEVACSSMLSK